MTEPLLWLDGDPTEGAAPACRSRAPSRPPRRRRRRPLLPRPAPAAASAPRWPAASSPPRSWPRGAVGLGLVDTGAPGRDRPARPRAGLAPPPAPSSRATWPPSTPRRARASSPCARTPAAAPASWSTRTGRSSRTRTSSATRRRSRSSSPTTAPRRRACAASTRSSDLAVLEVDTAQTGALRALELADSSTVRTGQLAVAIGSPFGLPQTATAGIVSGTGRHIQAPDGFQIDSVIQTDAPINPGNSGGPLLDANGRVIGVNSQIATGGNGNGNVGIGFAVPSNTVRDVIPRLERGETIRRAYLGVATARGERRRRGAGGHGGRPGRAGRRARRRRHRRGRRRARRGPRRRRGRRSRTGSPGESLAVEIRRGGDRRRSTSSCARPEQARDAGADELPGAPAPARARAPAAPRRRLRRRGAAPAPQRGGVRRHGHGRLRRAPPAGLAPPRAARAGRAWPWPALITALARPAGERRRAGRAGRDRAGHGPLRLDGGDGRGAVAARGGPRGRRGVPGRGAGRASGSAASCSTTAPRRCRARPRTAWRCAPRCAPR